MPATAARPVRTKPRYLRAGHRIDRNGAVVSVLRVEVVGSRRILVTVADAQGYADTFTARPTDVLLRHP